MAVTLTVPSQISLTGLPSVSCPDGTNAVPIRWIHLACSLSELPRLRRYQEVSFYMVCPVECIALYNGNCVPPLALKSGIDSEQAFWRWHKAEIKRRKQVRLGADQLMAWLRDRSVEAYLRVACPVGRKPWPQRPDSNQKQVLGDLNALWQVGIRRFHAGGCWQRCRQVSWSSGWL